MSRAEKIATIRDFVPRLREAIAGLTDEQLTTQYNPPEWTVAQNVHHLVDSHVNSYVRFKLILTEENPTLRPYDEVAFANLPEAMSPYLDDSLTILEGLHGRWTRMLEAITDAQWSQEGFHPENGNAVSLDDLLDYYAGHCDAHLAQLNAVKAKMGL
ncbi:MAG: DinB family protein [Chloroflexota bacterium]